MYWINATVYAVKPAVTPKTTRESVLIHFIDRFSSSREGVAVDNGSVSVKTKK